MFRDTVDPRDAARGRAPVDAAARRRWIRYPIGGTVLAVLVVEAVLARDELAKAWLSLLRADRVWLLAAVLAAAASMHSFARIQRTLLQAAGVPVDQWRSEAAFYAANSLSTTLPGGPVLSTTFLYRAQRSWGASPMVASWQLVMSGVLQGVGLAVLGLGGAVLLGGGHDPLALLAPLAGLLAVLGLAQAAATRPGLLDGAGVRALARLNALRGRPAHTGVAGWRGLLTQLESVRLGRRTLSVAFGWSLFNWIADVACLACAAYATGGHASPAGLTVAYAAARAVGTIPLMPGGLLMVEAVLVPGLVSAGLSWPDAISAMLVYRLISWLLIAAIGWVVFFAMFRGERSADPRLDAAVA